MLKRDEIADPTSCWNKAKDDDIVFILLQGDDASPETIRFWVNKRIELGKNKPGDRKMVTALQAADAIEAMQATKAV